MKYHIYIFFSYVYYGIYVWGLYTDPFYAIIPTLFSYFLPFCFLHFACYTFSVFHLLVLLKLNIGGEIIISQLPWLPLLNSTFVSSILHHIICVCYSGPSINYMTYKQLGTKASCKYEVVDTIRVC